MFYAGGAQSVRGFGENQLGPRVLTVPIEKLHQAFTVAPGTTDTTYTCPPTVDVRTCDPNQGLEDRDFTPRPIGGSTLAEGSVEYRFPIWQQLGGAVFVDGAFVGQGSLRSIAKGMGAVTPGAGVRYYSPVGPIRVDVGVNPHISERLSVITADSSGAIIELPTDNAHKRLYTTGGTGILSRLVLHLSIGQAF
jgi:outer membrane protein assembly factor BamA